jgi:glutaredoxin
VKTLLIERGVAFDVRDVSTDPQALNELTALGYMATPVTFIGGQAVVGFNRKRLEALIVAAHDS